jgi:hypothetical protein
LNSPDKCVPRTDDPLDQELAVRLNGWEDEREAEWRQSLRPAFVEIAWWLAGAAVVATITLIWLV